MNRIINVYSNPQLYIHIFKCMVLANSPVIGKPLSQYFSNTGRGLLWVKCAAAVMPER